MRGRACVGTIGNAAYPAHFQVKKCGVKLRFIRSALLGEGLDVIADYGLRTQKNREFRKTIAA